MQDLADSLGGASSDGCGRVGRGNGKRAGIDAGHAVPRRRAPALQRGGQLGAHRVCDPLPVPGVETVQNQFVDDHLDVAG